eukprot:CAMPEP_0170472800 /NCGR_PEP_ID=MMETSP0123-20130129/14796_1 /TAXON_ID=182087 /ORGANISM="Favella ehrenbergii, Strain Fehren 1" /LENGTH=86 /DNA_ID=CAMNT_0010741363 /DNA_START=736 /DNA_END=993 /DNA_ORIENTATION=-
MATVDFQKYMSAMITLDNTNFKSCERNRDLFTELYTFRGECEQYFDQPDIMQKVQKNVSAQQDSYSSIVSEMKQAWAEDDYESAGL